MIPLPLSLCMVVADEAHRLAPMLAYHRQIAADVVVVVQQSRDGTLAVAREWADTVIEHPRHGYAEASRAAAAAAGAYDVQLVLDGDELLTPYAVDMLPSWVEALQQGDRHALDGYRLARTTYLDGAHQHTGDAHLRLFDRRRVRFLDEVHTEPQADWRRVVTTPQVAILHTKSSAEQLRDEARVNALLTTGPLKTDPLRAQKLPLQHRIGRVLPSALESWHQIPGWLTPREADHLATLAARGGLAVEIGSYRGRSTVALGLGCLAGGGRLVAIDHYSGDPAVAGSGPDDEQATRAAVEAHGVPATVWRAHSTAAAAQWAEGPIDLLFIDGGHDRASVAADIAAWWPHLRAGAAVCFHDHVPGHGDGVRAAVAELLASGRAVWRGQIDGIAEVQHAG